MRGNCFVMVSLTRVYMGKQVLKFFFLIIYGFINPRAVTY